MRLHRLITNMHGNVRYRPYKCSSYILSGKDTRIEPKKEAHRWIADNFPDYIDQWSVNTFYAAGTGFTAASLTAFGAYGICQESILISIFVSGYWYLGYRDITQKSHTLLRNFPVLANFRYILEMLRPELRQYFMESDEDGKPFDRHHRAMAYQRAKGVPDTVPFGTRRNAYGPGYEFALHSLHPKVPNEALSREIIGGPQCTKPYCASILNVSGMSYGALSDNAVLALSQGAKLGGFYVNTGEGGVSRFHIEGGGDLVWNIGTGYFGCRNDDGTFSPSKFQQTATLDQIKMIEIKLSQGAKPGHGGLLPGPKVTSYIAEARGVLPGVDCHSPPNHSAFKDSYGLVDFIAQLRELSGGKPIGFKLCIGRPEEFTSVVHAMIEKNIYPDFITIDGGEGGTGAAPPEFSNTVGTPLVEGLTFALNILIGANIKDKIKIICAGKVLSGFSIVRNLALGADVCNSARAMLFALGCIQALKCNTNKCPTGITTQDKRLMAGLDVGTKSVRVYNYHKATVHIALDIIAAIGVDHPSQVLPSHIMRRPSDNTCKTLAELFPRPSPGSLLIGKGPHDIQTHWNAGVAMNKAIKNNKKI